MVDFEATLRSSLAGYAIEREIGTGAMAVVFLARDLKHDRNVAIKVLRPELTSAIGADRFNREIEVVAGLTHPHILPLHDSGDVDGLLYYVMPYISGGSLRDRLARDGRLPIPDATRITREIADALGFAHRRGVIHRDVKPANILLAEDHALLADFGIAHLAETEGGTLTGTGLTLGTPTYFSPEQATGEHDIDGRSDIYSLGCVLYETLTGEPPFTGPSVQALIAHHIVDEPPRAKQLRPDVSDGIEAVVQTALRKERGSRFQTAGEMAGSLDLVSGGFEVMAARALRKLLGPRYRWLHGWRLAGLTAAVLAILTAGWLGIRWLGEAYVAEGPSTYLLIPATGGGATEHEAALAGRATRILHLHLSDWPASIRVVDLGSLQGPVYDRQAAGFALPNLGFDAAEEIAKKAGASHIVHVRALALGDSLALLAEIREVRRLFSPGLTMREDGREQELQLLTAGLAIKILGLNGQAADYDQLVRRSENVTAQQEFDRGLEALQAWRLAEAEEQFRSALAADSTFPLAHHYLAQTLYWRTARDLQRLGDLGPEIERHARRADEFGSGDRLKPGERLHVDAFRAFWVGDYPEARVLYDSLLRYDPTDLEALILRGSVEEADPWLHEVSGGLVPRQDLRLARTMFDSAAYLRPAWELSLGRLFDVDYLLAQAAYEGTCYAFEPPPEERRPPYVTPEAAEQIAYCPLVRGDDVVWLRDSVPESENLASRRSIRALHDESVSLLERNARVEQNQARPHEELAAWMVWERSVFGCGIDPARADSLLRKAHAHSTRALEIRGDTTPEDRARFAGLLAARGELDRALEHADRALDELGDWRALDGPTPPAELANVYLAAGRADPTELLIRRSWGGDDYAVPDPSNDELIPAGDMYGVIAALRALGFLRADGDRIDRLFGQLERAWGASTYSERETAILKSDATSTVLPALALRADLWETWFRGWDDYGLEVPAIMQGFAAVETDPNRARRFLGEALAELDDRPIERRRATHYYLPLLLAASLGDARLEEELLDRAAACPLAVDRVDFAWGMKDLVGDER